MSEYRIDVKVRNNIILHKIEKAGYKTLGGFLRLNNITKYMNTLCDVVAMKRSPLNYKGEFLPAIIEIAELLNCTPEDLFSDIQMQTVLKNNKRSIQVNEAEMRFMLDQQNNTKLLEDIVHDNRLPNVIEETLNTLTPREQKIIEMRMGLGEYHREHTLAEIGIEFGVQSERIRQIEAKALRKLRNPERSGKLRIFLESESL